MTYKKVVIIATVLMLSFNLMHDLFHGEFSHSHFDTQKGEYYTHAHTQMDGDHGNDHHLYHLNFLLPEYAYTGCSCKMSPKLVFSENIHSLQIPFLLHRPPILL